MYNSTLALAFKMSTVDEEIELLDLEIEISEESDSYDSDDDDDGEVGELGEEEEEEELDDDVGQNMPRPYQHEPEPMQPVVGPGEQGGAVAAGDGVGFQGNRDVTRLDPRNMGNW